MEGETIIQFPANRVPAGTRLNGIYEVDSLIAEGGMGEVYRGHNILTNDPVAIKMILPELSGNPEAMALFRREASTLHNLYNEAIVRYYVFSIDPDLRRAYLAMEFVDGIPLSQRLKEGPLDLASVKVLQRRLAEGLFVAHGVGVIHRDISPDNVILPNGDVRRAKIIDFGIARSLQSSEATIIGGGFAGKYNYVSPEQLGLYGGDVTPLSDIYSLGLVLAECLRGRPLEMSGTQFEVVEKRRTLPDLSAIDASIRPLLQTMLQPDPAKRPADMSAVARWGESERVTPLAGAAIGHPEPRSRLPLLAGVAAAVLVAAGAGAYALRGEIATLAGFSEPVIEAREPVPLPPINSGDSGIVKQTTGAPAPVQEARLPEPAAPAALPPAAAPAEPGAAALPPPATAPAEPDAAALPPPATAPAEPSAAAAPAPATTPAAPLQPPAAAGQNSRVPTAEEILDAVNGKSGGKSSAATPPPSGQLQPALAPTPAPANAAPLPPRSSLALGDAAVGRTYEATLPPFTDAEGSSALTLRAGSDLPEGLTFRDGGSGVGVITGRPTASGSYDFAVTATDPKGASASMRLALNVEPAPTAPPPVRPAPTPAAPAETQPDLSAVPLPAIEPSMPPPVAPPVAAAPAVQATPPALDEAPAPADPAPSASTKQTEVAIVLPPVTPAVPPAAQAAKPVAQWVRDFGGGSCFFLRDVDAAGQSAFIEGFGDDVAAFQKLDSDFKQTFGFEPKIAMRKVAAAQCPALQLAATAQQKRPTIEIASPDVGRDRPLTGNVRDADGRHVALLLISNDGEATSLGRFISPGDGAFTVPLKPDARSKNAPQLLVAVASSEPLAALRDFRSGPADQLFAKLQAETGDGQRAAMDVKQFRMKE